MLLNCNPSSWKAGKRGLIGATEQPKVGGGAVLYRPIKQPNRVVHACKPCAGEPKAEIENSHPACVTQ